MKGNTITEFIGLRSKLYSLKYEDAYNENDQDCILVNLRDLFCEKSHEEKKIGKGIKKCVLENKIKFDDYDNVLINKTQLKREINFIKSKLHKVNTINIENICLSAYNNKSYILDNGIDMLRFGHYLIK